MVLVIAKAISDPPEIVCSVDSDPTVCVLIDGYPNEGGLRYPEELAYLDQRIHAWLRNWLQNGIPRTCSGGETS